VSKYIKKPPVCVLHTTEYSHQRCNVYVLQTPPLLISGFRVLIGEGEMCGTMRLYGPCHPFPQLIWNALHLQLSVNLNADVPPYFARHNVHPDNMGRTVSSFVTAAALSKFNRLYNIGLTRKLGNLFTTNVVEICPINCLHGAEPVKDDSYSDIQIALFLYNPKVHSRVS
jgi:hypothetical protein